MSIISFTKFVSFVLLLALLVVSFWLDELVIYKSVPWIMIYILTVLSFALSAVVSSMYSISFSELKKNLNLNNISDGFGQKNLRLSVSFYKRKIAQVCIISEKESPAEIKKKEDWKDNKVF